MSVELARFHAGNLQRRQVTNQRGDGGVRQLAQAFLQVSKGGDDHRRVQACGTGEAQLEVVVLRVRGDAQRRHKNRRDETLLVGGGVLPGVV